KKAPIRLERVGTVQPGKMAVRFSGDVASVEASHAEALRVAEDGVYDEILLPRIDASVYHAATGRRAAWEGDTLGVVESQTMAGAVLAADVAVKGADVVVLSVSLGDELGGKGLVHLMGEQHDVEAALSLVNERVPRIGRGLDTTLTPRLDDQVRSWLGRSTRFAGGGG
ncbi:MAG: BMC domain-containing protein, partial [Polyangiaceae bacterium]